MKGNHALLTAIVVLAVFSILVDFSNGIISRLIDLIFIGGAGVFSVKLVRRHEAELTTLRTERDHALLQLRDILRLQDDPLLRHRD